MNDLFNTRIVAWAIVKTIGGIRVEPIEEPAYDGRLRPPFLPFSPEDVISFVPPVTGLATLRSIQAGGKIQNIEEW